MSQYGNTNDPNAPAYPNMDGQQPPMYGQPQGQPMQQPMQPMQQPIYQPTHQTGQSMGQPMQGQPIYQPQQMQPIYAQPVYQPGQPMMGQPMGQPMMGQPMMGQPVGQPMQGQPVMMGAPVGSGQVMYAPGAPQQGTVVVSVVATPQMGMGKWSDDICDCFVDCTSTCLVCCVPPYRWALTVSRAGLGEFSSMLACYGIPWLICVIFSIVWISVYIPIIGIFWWILAVIMFCLGCQYRGKLRRKYAIPGDDCNDCLCYACCGCCAMAQEARHVDRVVGMFPVRP